MVVKNWEGYLSCRGPFRGVRGPSPTLGSPAAGIPSLWVRWKAARNPGILLKGLHINSLAHSIGIVALRAPETYREKLSGVASEHGLEGQLPLPLC